ncbi:hypothetical protein KQI77_12645 [Clostridium sp. MSJ-8]|uniref:hypothetical protein n=1 Tax=Clostridium sp. MSJ-8 TaxID=2841510 RepID=UPI001C0EC938|nr:hypothetical protein [Clostridium sp. MSJ-8]MBU5488976.1 hypothetical protein [Clostridium sp. MSJ-8]
MIGLAKALVIFLIYLVFNIALICITNLGKGKLVNNTIKFSMVHIYPVIVALLLIYMKSASLMSIVSAFFYIAISVVSVMIMKAYFLEARLLTSLNIVMVNIAFWYPEKQLILIIVTLAISALGYLLLKFLRDKAIL